LPAIVEAIHGIAGDLMDRVRKAERQRELARRARLAEQAAERRAEDRRRVGISIKESREDLKRVIRAWSDTMNLVRFFEGVETSAARLDPHQRKALLARVAFARQFVGSEDPFAFFLAWKTPGERYKPRYRGGEESADASQDVRQEDE
jgi:hypothetical protein